ncbi:MAG: GTP 3',8-cyclase MoaA [Desulfuromonadales bacterium]|nr:GTP 3',8-cyclase MoaA [Desulfuromonadales bacterium]
MELLDSYGRKINYLRLAITDRCNLRCQYCMPAEGVPKQTHNDILSFEELLLLAKTAISMGIEKVRVTGGEPLVRKGIVDFLARLASIAGLKHLVLTTNGLLLQEMAADLRGAGVQRLNISLDSLQPETFKRITRCGDLARVMAGIDAAEKAGLPIKLNMVVMRGINDAEILDFVRLSIDKLYTVRFIEYMPTIKEDNWKSLVMPGREILNRIENEFEFKSLDHAELAGPAQNYKIDGALGSFGLITPLSNHFCGACNRIRVTSSGKVWSCLFSEQEYDLKPFLRSKDATAVKVALRRITTAKPEKHQISCCEAEHKAFTMSSIGG